MQLFRSELDLVVQSGLVYLPLLFDPRIAEEIRDRSDGAKPLDGRASGSTGTVIVMNGRHFVRSVSLQSVLASYQKIDAEYYEQVKRDLLPASSNVPALQAVSPNGKLRTILLKVMPYFIRQRKGLERRRLDDEELLDLVCSKIDIPRGFLEQADQALDPGRLLQRLNDLPKIEESIEPLEDGPVSGEALRTWVRKALEAQIVSREKARIEQELRAREQLGGPKRLHMAALLHIADKGSFELDGFGFLRVGSSGDYLVYKRTGEYILKDYYARSYLFPDCRVAVSTWGPFRPMVLDLYKHPFLFGHAPKQEICMGAEYDWPNELTADNLVRLLEDGINALLFGYDPRRRNGYHSLDPILNYVKTVEFEEYRVSMEASPAASDLP